MANKLKHLRSGIAGTAPTNLQIELGQIAINYQDEYLFILNGNDEVIVIASAAAIARANSSITSINTKTGDVNGAVTLLPADIGANGVPYLDVSGKIPVALLPESVVGAVVYKGTYDAATNTPALPDATASKGWYYVVNVAGTQQGLTLGNGDWVISNGTAWEKVDALDAVTSVAGKTGAVVLAAGDIASGVFAAARLGSAPGNDMVLTTDGTGAPVWVAKSAISGVTSVGLAAPAALLGVSGSPVTGTGTLTITLPARAANLVFAGPASGANAAPSFRALDPADIPVLDEGTF